MNPYLAWLNLRNEIGQPMEHWFFNFVLKVDYWELLLDTLGDVLLLKFDMIHNK